MAAPCCLLYNLCCAWEAISAQPPPTPLPHTTHKCARTRAHAHVYSRLIDNLTHKRLPHTPPRFPATSPAAYFTAIMEGIGRAQVDVDAYWSRELDTDGDGQLSDNEFRTLASVVFHRAPTPADIAALRNCTAPEEESLSEVYEGVRAAADGPVRVKAMTLTRSTPLVTLQRVLACELAMTGLSKFARVAATHEEAPHDEVAFEMITDDFNRTRAQLDSIRSRKAKFICINDDLREAPPTTRQLLSDFYSAMLPHASAFELPDGQTNHEPLYIEAITARTSAAQDLADARTPWIFAAGFAGLVAVTLVRRGGGKSSRGRRGLQRAQKG